MFELEFNARSNKTIEIFKSLDRLPLFDFVVQASDRGRMGIYVLYEDDENGNFLPVYVGRTRNLQQRFRAHITAGHNSASYALKRTRKKLGLPTTYRAEGSRKWIEENHMDDFKEQIECIKAMKFRFFEVEDDIDQYLLELCATMALNLELDGFRTS